MIAQCLPKVDPSAGYIATRDYRKVASLARTHLREKRQRMTLRDIADMLGETSCDYRNISPESPLFAAMEYLVEVGLARLVGKHYEATDVIVRGIYRAPQAGMTSEVANRSQSAGMAIKNRHLGKRAA